MDRRPYKESTAEQIASRALLLLRQEPKAEQERLRLWAEDEFEKVGILGGTPHRGENDNQFVADLIGHNPYLGDWMRARHISPENVLNAESFMDLIDWLTPGYLDE